MSSVRLQNSHLSFGCLVTSAPRWVKHPADRWPLGRALSPISRELRRNASGAGVTGREAHRRATTRRTRTHQRRIETNSEPRQSVAELLA
jgi:hypothetical protein